jgi:FlgD Ig-like domain
MTPRTLAITLLALLAVPILSWATSAAPGDTASTVVLEANFNGDAIGLSPDTSLPGGPPGDFLTLNTTAGTILVSSAIDGLTLKPVEMKQSNTAGGLELRAWTAPQPPGCERATVRWRSLARDANPVFLMRCAVRSASGDVIASVDYRPSRVLTYNLGSTIPVPYVNNRAQQFTIVVDFVNASTSLSIDGVAVPGFQNVPFLSPATSAASISYAGDESHPQSLVLDDVSVVVFARDPDRSPVVTAPVAVDGEETGTIQFPISASDPDGDPIGSLTMDSSELPTGADAVLNLDPGNTGGTFVWHPQIGHAGAYDVVFTAVAGGASSSASTHINIAVLGTSITGTCIWTPEPGEEGPHFVTFTGVDSRGDSTSAVTEIFVTAPAATTQDAARAGTAPRLQLSPTAIQKGPIVSVPVRVEATVGSTVTVTATATDTTGLLSGAAAPRPGISLGSLAPSARSGGVPSLTLIADLSQVPGAVFLVDQDPVVTAPAEVSGEAGVPISFSVGASDPDGDALLTLTADLAGLPTPNNAVFTKNPSNTSGLFQWTPGVSDSGSYEVSFIATNNLVGSASTRLRVRGTPSARVFLPGNKRIRLSSNKPSECVYLEAAGGSFDLREIDPATIRLISQGTGLVEEIPAISGKTMVIGDKDGNLIQDLQTCFTKANLRLLFGGLRGNVVVPVTVRGSLITGQTFQGSASLPVNAGNGGFLASVSPNPLNPLGTLRFTTRRPDRVTVRIYDPSGRLVRQLWSGALPAGDHELAVDGRDTNGDPVASGIYFYRVESVDEVETGRFTIMK